MKRRAVFLDRDGVLVEDAGLVTRTEQFQVLEGTAEALALLRAAGFALVVVTNQTVVARGLASEGQVALLHDWLGRTLRALGAGVDAFFTCPHHPQASVETYRLECACRKPRPGLLLQAAQELGLDCHRSVLVGDRGSDIAAGRAAGCRTILVTTGRHLDPPIESPDGAYDGTPDRACATLLEAARLIVAGAV